jgi:hypothetical protein
VAIARFIVACKPTRRGQDLDVQRVVQARAAACVARAIESVQGARVQDWLLNGIGPNIVARSHCTIHEASWAWDETSQRMRCRSKPVGVSTLPLPHAPSQGQIMMQMGAMNVFKFSDAVAGRARLPLFAKASLLVGQKSDNIPEGLLRKYPLPLLDGHTMEIYAGKCDYLLLNFCADRAGVNRVIMKWILQHCISRLPF